MNEKQIERINKERRNIPTEVLFRKKDIANYLSENLKPSWNLLINGSGSNRKSTLYHWIMQVYLDEELSNRPVVILSEDTALLDMIEQIIYEGSVHRNRPFAKISTSNPVYKPFEGMDSYELESALQEIGKKDSNFNPDEWNSTVFHDVCRIIEKYGYELSLDNLRKVFNNPNGKIIKMLRHEGYSNSAESAAKNGFSQIYSTIDRKWNLFNNISSYENGISVLGEVLKRKRNNRRMPCVCFSLTDKIRNSFLEYLSCELKAISNYCDPVIIIDSIPLYVGEDDTGNSFFNYLSESANISLCMSSEACDSLVPGKHLEPFIKSKGFRMCFTTGGASGEQLTRIELGGYDHIIVEKTKGKVKETFSLISHDKHSDISTREDTNRARIRAKDLTDLEQDEAYFVYRERGYMVKGLIF